MYLNMYLPTIHNTPTVSNMYLPTMHNTPTVSYGQTHTPSQESHTFIDDTHTPSQESHTFVDDIHTLRPDATIDDIHTLRLDATITDAQTIHATADSTPTYLCTDDGRELERYRKLVDEHKWTEVKKRGTTRNERRRIQTQTNTRISRTYNTYTPICSRQTDT